jgi:predicted nucleotidyltransferase
MNICSARVCEANYVTTLPTAADVVTVLTRSLTWAPDIDLCLLYGSFARGTATAGSDIDILVVTEKPGASARFAERLWLDCPPIADLASITTLRACDVRAENRIRPSFIAHLRDEGELLGCSRGGNHTSVLVTLRSETTSDAIHRELELRLDRLARSLGRGRLNGHFTSALGRLYSVGKAVCMARLVEVGDPEYDWRLVFDSFAETWPTLREEATLIANLRPFYEQLRGTHDGALRPTSKQAQLLDDSMRCLKEVAIASGT